MAIALVPSKAKDYPILCIVKLEIACLFTLGKKVVKIGQKIEWGSDGHKHCWSSWGYNFRSFKGMTLKLIQATMLDSRKILE